MCRGNWLLVGIILTLLFSDDVAAQGRPLARSTREYFPLDPPRNLEAILAQHLARSQTLGKFGDLDSLKDLWKKWAGDGSVPAINPETIRPQLENPAFREYVQGWLEQPAIQSKFDPGQLEDLKNALKSIDGKGPLPSAADLPKDFLDSMRVGSPPPRGWFREEDVQRWARQFLKNLENSNLGSYLRDSRAFQEAMGGMQKLLMGERPDSPDWMKQWTDRLPRPERIDLDLPEWNLNLPGLSMSGLPEWNLRLPGMGNWSMPVPGFGPPPMPTSGGLEIGAGFLWVVVAGLGVFVLWRMLGRPGWVQILAPKIKELGPWPVDPSHLTSREEVVAAVDYLALLQLGPEARTWNHRLVGDRLAQAGTAASERLPVADRLVNLYAQARYAPTSELLSTNDLATASSSVCLLAKNTLP